MSAYGADNWSLSGNAQPDPRIAPFLAGTTWADGTKLIDYTGVSMGFANGSGKYAISANADGTGKLIVGPNGLGGAGLDVMLVRAVSPSSTGSIVVENPGFVVKT